MTPEIKAYAGLIDSHLSQMIDRLRQISIKDRNWRPAIAAPAATNIAAVTFEWLVADRLHIVEPDPTRHARIDVPEEYGNLCDALDAERGRWRELTSALDPVTLDDVRYHFGVFPRDVRFMLVHIAQQVIYKNGQLSTLFFALELDGAAPFTAPVPSTEYDALAAAMAAPVFNAVLTDRADLVDAGVDSVNRVGPTGQTPLKLAVLRDNAPLVGRLVQLGADPNEADEYGCTLLMYAAFTHRRYSGKALIDAGANTGLSNRWGITARAYAEMEDNTALLDCLVSPTFDGP